MKRNAQATQPSLIQAATEPVLKSGDHTPGPWKVWQSRIDNSINVHGPDHMFVCEVGKISGDAYSDSTVKADARLIAAVPQMLASLKLAYARLDDKAAKEEIGALLNSLDGDRHEP